VLLGHDDGYFNFYTLSKVQYVYDVIVLVGHDDGYFDFYTLVGAGGAPLGAAAAPTLFTRIFACSNQYTCTLQ
jgi:hypothetical protein